MRVFVKDMSGNYIHATTPRKARLLLKEKKAVIESNNPFTIRLLFPASECGLKDSNPSNTNKSDVTSERDNIMCEDKLETKEIIDKGEQDIILAYPKSKTHLIFGAYGCGKSTYLRQLINDKTSNGIDVCLLTNQTYARTYFRKEVDHLHIILLKDIPFDETLDVVSITKALLNACIGKVGRNKLKIIAVDGVDLTHINNDYVEEEYFRELSRRCKENNINLLYTKGVDGEKEVSYHKLPFIYEKFSDIITIIK